RVGLAEGRDDVLAEQLDRPHDLVRRDAVGVHETEELVAARRAIALDALAAARRVADDHGAQLGADVEGDVSGVEVAQRLRVGVGAHLALEHVLPGCERADQLRALAQVPDYRLRGVSARVLVRLRAVHHRERGGARVDELAGGLRLGETVAIELDASRELLRRHADGEGEQPDTLAAGEPVALRAGGRHPQRGTRALHGPRMHPARRGPGAATAPPA